MKLKGWFVVSIVVTIIYFVAGILYLVGGIMPLKAFNVIGFVMLFNGIISLAGTVSFVMKNYKAAQTLFIISGLLGFPIGILLIIFGVLIDKLPNEN